MSDDVDRANDLAAADLARGIAAARAPIPAGEPGECEDCGEEMPRLVNGRCGYCRDGRRRAA
jgi:RNA polymerase-binding transcription factor DksA